MLAPLPRGFNARLGSFNDQISLELRQSAHHVKKARSSRNPVPDVCLFETAIDVYVCSFDPSTQS
jgi:hypothetical protein